MIKIYITQDLANIPNKATVFFIDNKKIICDSQEKLKIKKIIYDEKYFGKLSYGVLNRLISTLATEEKIKEITSNNKILTKNYYMKK